MRADGRDQDVWNGYFTPDKVGVGTFGLIASEAAYDRGEPWFDDVLARLSANRSLLTDLVDEHLPKAGLHPPEGTYLAWLDLSGYGLGDPAAFCLDEARVAVTGAGQDGVFRVPDMESALAANFAPDAVADIAVPDDDLNSDIHASAEYRAHLISVMASRAVAAA